MEKLTNERSCMTVRDLQLELGVSRPVAYQLAMRSDFPSFRIGKRILIPRESFSAWLSAQVADKRGAEVR